MDTCSAGSSRDGAGRAARPSRGGPSRRPVQEALPGGRSARPRRPLGTPPRRRRNPLSRRPPRTSPPGTARPCGTASRRASATHRRRVRDRSARRIVTTTRQARSSRCWSRCWPSTGRAPQGRPRAAAARLRRRRGRHRGQLRKSGDPYITHPLAVATILADLGMDTTTLVAALLHDTVEDTGVHARRADARSSATRSRTWSTASPSSTRSSSATAAEAETIRKMIVAMARDPRVLVIKLADRLHNMRTLRFLPPAKQERKARETLEVLAPLAHRLGMNTVKWELEDLAFATLYPKRYDEIVRLVAERAPQRDAYLTEVIERVNSDLHAGGIKAEVDRPAQALLLDLPEDDRPRPRVHRHLRPGRHPGAGRRPSATATPRSGVDPRELAAGAGPVQGLHRDAEVQHVPVAAHHRDRPGRQAGRAADPHPRHAPHRRVRHRRALEVQGDQGHATRAGRRRDEMALAAPAAGLAARGRRSPGSSWTTLRFDLGASEVFVFTPKGDVIALPAGSTPVDFAYAVHTEVGHRCIGARVNGKLVALETHAGPRRHRRGLHLQGRERRAVAGTGWPSSPRRGPRPRSGSGSPRNAARTRSRPARTALTRAMRQAACPCSGCSAATSWSPSPGTCS